MKKNISILGAIFLLNILLQFPVFALNISNDFSNNRNQCIRCHSQITAAKDEGLARAFREWQSSDHKRHGVFCNDCHGGDPEISKVDDAHGLIKNTKDPDSPLFPKNIPQTCGKCHKIQFEYFSKSFHYKKLKESNDGPTCVTCHGSRKNSVLKPVEIKEKCRICHNESNHPDIPRRIVDFFIFLDQVKLDILRAESSILKAEVTDEKMDLKPFQSHLEKAIMITAEISKKWHLFDIEKTYSAIMDAHKEANMAAIPEKSGGKATLVTMAGLIGIAILITVIVIATRKTKKT